MTQYQEDIYKMESFNKEQINVILECSKEELSLQQLVILSIADWAIYQMQSIIDARDSSYWKIERTTLL